MNKARKAIYPGTFDPVTLGHLDIIHRASKIFDHLVVAIAVDSIKVPLFTLAQRLDMVQRELAGLENVEVKTFNGLLVNFVIEHEADVVIRGLRALSDFEYEFQMAYINYKMNPKVETVFLPATEDSHYISSSFVKQIAKLGGDVTEFVSQPVSDALKKKFDSKQLA